MTATLKPSPPSSNRVAVIRAAMPEHLCPQGFDVLAAWLRRTDAPPEVWAGLRHAQTGAVRLRATAMDALRYAERGL